MVSMKDIAKKCGVSVASVSKALNGQKDVSEETRRRICATAEEMGYMANPVARALKTNRSYHLGLLLMDEYFNGLGNEYFCSTFNAFKAEAESHGYDITFINHYVGDQPASYAKHCKYRVLDGILVAGVNFENPRIQELCDINIPLVTIDHCFEGRTAILSDNRAGIAALVRHAYEKGHRKIAYLHGEDCFVTRSRLEGFRETCRELGLDIPEEYIVPCSYWNYDISEQATRKLLDLPDPPTCILFPNDFAFIGGHNAIRENNCSIPGLPKAGKQISVIGYNGVHLARMMRLCTYEQNASLVGKTAAEQLIQAIEHPEEAIPRQIVIPGRLLEGVTILDLNR